jgi:hypothetical protein
MRVSASCRKYLCQRIHPPDASLANPKFAGLCSPALQSWDFWPIFNPENESFHFHQGKSG